MECLTPSCLKRYAALGFLDLFYGVIVNLRDRRQRVLFDGLQHRPRNFGDLIGF